MLSRGSGPTHGAGESDLSPAEHSVLTLTVFNGSASLEGHGLGEVIFHYPLMELQCTLGHRRPTAATRCRNPRRACRHSEEISRGSVGFLVIVLMMVFGGYEVMSEAVMSVFKDFSHVATPGRDPPGYQFPC